MKTLCVETAHAVKFPKMVRQATGQIVEPPEDLKDVFERKQIKIELPADEAAVRAELVRLAGSQA